MENNKPSWCNNQRTHSLVMVLTGMAVWLLSDSGLPNSQNIVQAVGIFLFIYGTSTMHHDKKWDALSRKQKTVKIAVTASLGLLVAIGLVLLLARR